MLYNESERLALLARATSLTRATPLTRTVLRVLKKTCAGKDAPIPFFPCYQVCPYSVAPSSVQPIIQVFTTSKRRQIPSPAPFSFPIKMVSSHSRSQSPRVFWSAPRHGAPESEILGLPLSWRMCALV